MVNIECRNVATQKLVGENPPGYKLSGAIIGLREQILKNMDDVDCDLQNGLVCRPARDGLECADYEVRMKCECE